LRQLNAPAAHFDARLNPGPLTTILFLPHALARFRRSFRKGSRGAKDYAGRMIDQRG
jgi:hypothetical protein